jgi:hypothetical protein
MDAYTTRALATVRTEAAKAQPVRAVLAKVLGAYGLELAAHLTDAECSVIRNAGLGKYITAEEPKPVVKAAAPVAAPVRIIDTRGRVWRSCGYPGCSQHGCDNCQD